MIVQLGIVTCVFIPVGYFFHLNFEVKLENIESSPKIQMMYFFNFNFCFQVKNLILANFVEDVSGQTTTNLVMKRNVLTDTRQRKILLPPTTPKPQTTWTVVATTKMSIRTTVVSPLRRSCWIWIIKQYLYHPMAVVVEGLPTFQDLNLQPQHKQQSIDKIG